MRRYKLCGMRLFFVFLLFFGGLPSYSAKCLVISLTDGTKVYYSFEKYFPLIRFVDGVMRVSTRKFDFSRVESFSVIEDPQSVESLESGPRFHVDGNTLAISSSAKVQIYSVQGVLQSIEVTASDNMQYVDLSPLSAGVFVVRCGNSSFTIYKK